ncbi:MAG: hypothetical protein LBC72_00580, partial [Spirochaetaceae bacterium]|nr:hypothetical protein [Spirochaetaceae bacterium]
MKTIKLLCAAALCARVALGAFAQAAASVPLSDPVYRLLESAELRGLSGPLMRVKPYSRAAILSLINQIENAPDSRFALGATEREALRAAARRLSAKEPGFHPARGFFRAQTTLPDGRRIAAEAGGALDAQLSGALYLDDSTFGAGPAGGLDIWPRIYAAGDIGEAFSFSFTIQGGVMFANRDYLGENYTYYKGYNAANGITAPDETHPVYTQPRAFFPYSYRPGWDGIVWEVPYINNADFLVWPSNWTIGYGTRAEIAGTALSGVLRYRAGRFEREYGGMMHGSSLDLNAAAQPFFGFDIELRPFSWLNISSVTGILEFYSERGIKNSAWTFQSAYSLSQIELLYKNYFYLGFGSAVVWPKRFELGYMLPLVDKHLYQMSIGDFDNTAEFANLRLQYPGVGSLWASLFLDEINPEKDIFSMDRALYSYQAGISFNIAPL